MTDKVSRHKLLRSLTDIATRHRVSCRTASNESEQDTFEFLLERDDELIVRIGSEVIDAFPGNICHWGCYVGKPGEFAGYGVKVVVTLPVTGR